MSAVNDKWDQFESFKKYDEFTIAWLSECKRILKKNGVIWVIGRLRHFFLLILVLLEFASPDGSASLDGSFINVGIVVVHDFGLRTPWPFAS